MLTWSSLFSRGATTAMLDNSGRWDIHSERAREERDGGRYCRSECDSGFVATARQKQPTHDKTTGESKKKNLQFCCRRAFESLETECSRFDR